jgi:hypothetical protein
LRRSAQARGAAVPSAQSCRIRIVRPARGGYRGASPYCATAAGRSFVSGNLARRFEQLSSPAVDQTAAADPTPRPPP